MADPIAQSVVAEVGNVPGRMRCTSDMNGPISDFGVREIFAR
jgi:hypothetical protein